MQGFRLFEEQVQGEGGSVRLLIRGRLPPLARFKLLEILVQGFDFLEIQVQGSSSLRYRCRGSSSLRYRCRVQAP